MPDVTTSGPEPTSASNQRLRALVMDDDPLFRTLLVAMLKRDYAVVAAVDGSDGFYKAVEAPPDIAVVDIQMPVWDGIRTIKAFREHAALCRIPLLVLTSDTTQGTVLAAIGAGADDYLIKSSFNREEMLQKLQSLWNRRLNRRASLAETRGENGADQTSVKAGSAISQDRNAELAGAASRAAAHLQETIDAWE